MKSEDRVLLLIFAVGIIIAMLSAQPEITEFVNNRTVETRSNIFFDYTIVRYPAQVEVLNVPETSVNLTLGFNVGVDELDFSSQIKGNSVKKQINLTTRDGRKSRIMAMTYGDITPLIIFDNNDFVLEGDGVLSLILDTTGAESGNYTGEIDVIIQRSKHDILRNIVGY